MLHPYMLGPLRQIKTLLMITLTAYPAGRENFFAADINPGDPPREDTRRMQAFFSFEKALPRYRARPGSITARGEAAHPDGFDRRGSPERGAGVSFLQKPGKKLMTGGIRPGLIFLRSGPFGGDGYAFSPKVRLPGKKYLKVQDLFFIQTELYGDILIAAA